MNFDLFGFNSPYFLVSFITRALKYLEDGALQHPEGRREDSFVSSMSDTQTARCLNGPSWYQHDVQSMEMEKATGLND